MEAAFATVTADEAMARLEKAGIACARMRTIREFFEHPQLQARDRWRPGETPHGSIQALLPPVTVHGHEPLIGPVPSLGQHNDRLRAEFGDPSAVPGSGPAREIAS